MVSETIVSHRIMESLGYRASSIESDMSSCCFLSVLYLDGKYISFEVESTYGTSSMDGDSLKIRTVQELLTRSVDSKPVRP